jgi:hypothetical protein
MLKLVPGCRSLAGYYKIFANVIILHCFCHQLYHSYFKCRIAFRCGIDRSEYISQIIFTTEPSSFIKALIAMSAIILFYGVNLMGLKMSSRTQNVLMIIKIGLVVLLISSLFFPSNYASQTIKAIVPDPSWNDYIKSFGIALIAVSFTYGAISKP